MIRLACITAVYLALCVGTANAEKHDVDNLLALEQGNGLIVTIPVSGVQELLTHLTTYHSALNKQRSEYVIQVEETKFGVKDALIAAILPGGLIYAANKKQQHDRVKADLLDISDQLAELSLDVNHFVIKSSTQTVALLK